MDAATWTSLDAAQQRLEVGSTEGRTEIVDQGGCRGARQEPILMRSAGIAHRQAKQEAVALSLREW